MTCPIICQIFQGSGIKPVQISSPWSCAAYSAPDSIKVPFTRNTTLPWTLRPASRNDLHRWAERAVQHSKATARRQQGDCRRLPLRKVRCGWSSLLTTQPAFLQCGHVFSKCSLVRFSIDLVIDMTLLPPLPIHQPCHTPAAKCRPGRASRHLKGPCRSWHHWSHRPCHPTSSCIDSYWNKPMKKYEKWNRKQVN